MDKTTNEFFKTSGDFFDFKKLENQDQVIQEKPEER